MFIFPLVLEWPLGWRRGYHDGEEGPVTAKTRGLVGSTTTKRAENLGFLLEDVAPHIVTETQLGASKATASTTGWAGRVHAFRSPGEANSEEAVESLPLMFKSFRESPTLGWSLKTRNLSWPMDAEVWICRCTGTRGMMPGSRLIGKK